MEWISVKERLPKVGQSVFVYATTRPKENQIKLVAMFTSWLKDDGRKSVFEGDTDENGFMLMVLHGRLDYRGFHVTHWMPLPASPKEE